MLLPGRVHLTTQQFDLQFSIVGADNPLLRLEVGTAQYDERESRKGSTEGASFPVYHHLVFSQGWWKSIRNCRRSSYAFRYQGGHYLTKERHKNTLYYYASAECSKAKNQPSLTPITYMPHAGRASAQSQKGLPRPAPGNCLELAL